MDLCTGLMNAETHAYKDTPLHTLLCVYNGSSKPYRLPLSLTVSRFVSTMAPGLQLCVIHLNHFLSFPLTVLFELSSIQLIFIGKTFHPTLFFKHIKHTHK